MTVSLSLVVTETVSLDAGLIVTVRVYGYTVQGLNESESERVNVISRAGRFYF